MNLAIVLLARITQMTSNRFSTDDRRTMVLDPSYQLGPAAADRVSALAPATDGDVADDGLVRPGLVDVFTDVGVTRRGGAVGLMASVSSSL